MGEDSSASFRRRLRWHFAEEYHRYPRRGTLRKSDETLRRHRAAGLEYDIRQNSLYLSEENGQRLCPLDEFRHLRIRSEDEGNAEPFRRHHGLRYESEIFSRRHDDCLAKYGTRRLRIGPEPFDGDGSFYGCPNLCLEGF